MTPRSPSGREGAGRDAGGPYSSPGRGGGVEQEGFLFNSLGYGGWAFWGRPDEKAHSWVARW